MVDGKKPLPSVEAILQKRAAGEKLTRAEAGKIGGAFRGGRKISEPAVPREAPRRLAVADGVEAPRPALLPPPPPVDADLCKSTAGEILDTLNEAGQSSIAAKAKKIEASAADVQAFLQLAALKPGERTTMVNTAPSWLPKLLRTVGLDAANAPEAMAGMAALLWGLGFFRASRSLDNLAAEKIRRDEAEEQAARVQRLKEREQREAAKP